MKKHIGYIENGINLDHIPCGNAWYIMKILGLDNHINQTGIGLNLPSKKMKTKDLIKVENRILTAKEIDAIGLFARGATLTIIQDFKVTEKITIPLPEIIEKLIVCPNSRCISSQYQSKFKIAVNKHNKVSVVCHYFEQIYLLDEITKYNI